ncbi:hypothetical protein [Streptomyces bambusae]|uniref:hypothetical protein n=1 Tax=Streptomyces bambusae TaxID=1550616 RepID=UPI0027E14C9F|nr:hypothetical protein [Streptomyces bambusae]
MCELRITGPVLRGRVALAWRTDGPAGPAARTLLELLREALPAVEPGPPAETAATDRP